MTTANSLVIFVVIVLIVIGSRYPNLITTPLQTISLNLNNAKNNFLGDSGDFFYSFFVDKSRLIKENDRLKNLLEKEREFCYLSIQSLEIAKQNLENALGRKSTREGVIGTAFVIGKPPIIPYGAIAVDLGGIHGVKVGDIVLAGDYIIGAIADVKNDFSLVKLIGEKNEERNVLIGEKRLAALAVGQGLGAFETKLDDQSAELLNSIVKLAEFPEFIFGVVTATERSASSQYYSLLIQSPVNTFELSQVEIVSNEK